MAATLEKMPASLQINPVSVQRLGLPGVCANNTQCFTGVGNSLVRGARGPGNYSDRCLVLVVTFDLLGTDSPKPMFLFPVTHNWKVFGNH